MIYQCYPKKIEIFVSNCKHTAKQVRQLTGCDNVINGGLYDMGTQKPVCHLKVYGDVLASDQYGYLGYGWNSAKDIAMVSNYANYLNYICCVAMIRNGQAEKMIYQPALGGSRPRTMLGMMKDGRIVTIATQEGYTPEQLQAYALKLGLYSAVMMDSGASTQGSNLNDEVKSSRKVHNYICIWEDKTRPVKKYNPHVAPIRNIAMWSSGEGAAHVQWVLKNLRGYDIKDDGYFYWASTKALKEFQAKNGLVADGIWGPNTAKVAEGDYTL